MAFLGLFKRGLENIKAEDVRKDIQGMEREEDRLGRQAYSYRAEIETQNQYAMNEPNMSESELAHVASQIHHLNNSLAATDDELFRLRDEKRAAKRVFDKNAKARRCKGAKGFIGRVAHVLIARPYLKHLPSALAPLRHCVDFLFIKHALRACSWSLSARSGSSGTEYGTA